VSTLTIIDLGLGNPSSVLNMVRRIGHEVELRTFPDGLGSADRYILPGVGAFDEGVRRLHNSGWFEHLTAMPPNTPILGICLGMQLLANSSEEGSLEGIGRVAAHFVRFRGVERVPHMGWNTAINLRDDPIFDPKLPEYRYYFTHTYHAICESPDTAIASTVYGNEFPSAYRVGNTCGVQFHPEKSHKYGMSLLKRWIEFSC